MYWCFRFIVYGQMAQAIATGYLNGKPDRVGVMRGPKILPNCNGLLTTKAEGPRSVPFELGLARENEMTDRELLILAAKAMGPIDGHSLPFGPENYAAPGELEHGWGMVRNMDSFWNPLENDGDALRLAVALRMNISQIWDRNCVEAQAARSGGKNRTCWHSEKRAGDPYAGTRRAIVRAAAALVAN